MACVRCASNNQMEFSTEMVFHFPGLQGLDRECLFLYPKVLVCLQCGLSQFTTPVAEKALLAKGGMHLRPANGGTFPAIENPPRDHSLGGVRNRSLQPLADDGFHRS